MFKRFSSLTSRLICFGSARACTNSVIPAEEYEDDLVHQFNP